MDETSPLHTILQEGLMEVIKTATDKDILEEPYGHPIEPYICQDEDHEDYYDPPFVFEYGFNPLLQLADFIASKRNELKESENKAK